MADRNGTVHHLSDTAIEAKLTGDPITSGYRSSLPIMSMWSQDGTPIFRVLWDVEPMQAHSSIKLAMQNYCGAIQNAEFVVEASGQQVADFALDQIEKFWSTCLNKLQKSCYYGWGGFEPIYETEKHKTVFADLVDFAPRDVVPLSIDNKYIGIRVKTGNIVYTSEGMKTAGKESPWDLWGPRRTQSCPKGKFNIPAKGFWYVHSPHYNRWFGRTQMYAAWRAWRRLAGPDGAENSLDGGMYRFAYEGPLIRYPERDGRKPGSNEPDSYRNRAREIGENAKAGVSRAYPSTKYPQDQGGGYLWEEEWPQRVFDAKGLLDYVEYLKGEIAAGIGVPKELMEASDVGSGYSGRAIPMEAFLMAQQGNANDVLKAFVDQILEPLILWNFGVSAWIKVKIKPLLETKIKASRGQGQQPQGAMPPPGAPPAGGPPPGAMPGPPEPPPQAGRPEGQPGQEQPGNGKPDNDALSQLLGMKLSTVRLGRMLGGEIIGGYRESGSDTAGGFLRKLDGTMTPLVRLGWVNAGVSKTGMPKWRREENNEIRYQRTQPGLRGERVEDVSKDVRQAAASKPEQPSPTKRQVAAASKAAGSQAAAQATARPPLNQQAKKAIHTLAQQAYAAMDDDSHPMARFAGKLQNARPKNGMNLPAVKTLIDGVNGVKLTTQDHAKMANLHQVAAKILQAAGSHDRAESHRQMAMHHAKRAGKGMKPVQQTKEVAASGQWKARIAGELAKRGYEQMSPEDHQRFDHAWRAANAELATNPAADPKKVFGSTFAKEFPKKPSGGGSADQEKLYKSYVSHRRGGMTADQAAALEPRWKGMEDRLQKEHAKNKHGHWNPPGDQIQQSDQEKASPVDDRAAARAKTLADLHEKLGGGPDAEKALVGLGFKPHEVKALRKKGAKIQLSLCRLLGEEPGEVRTVLRTAMADRIIRLGAGPHKYGSTQFDLPRHAAELCRLFSDEKIDSGDLSGDGRESEFHVTIKYGLTTADADEVAAAVRGFGPVTLTLGSVSIFPAKEASAQRGGDEHDVVKIDVEGDALHRLHRLLCKRLDHTDTHPMYKPHVTLAYVKAGMGEKYAGRSGAEGETCTFDEFIFSDAEGNRYVIPLREESGVWLSTAHAPAGGVTIGGKPFTGGEFIPGDVMAKATESEKKAVVEASDDVKRTVKGESGRVAEMKQAASHIAFSDEVVAAEEIGRRDYGAIEEGMTAEEKRDMNRYLDRIKDEAINDQMMNFEADIDERSLARDSDLSASDIEEKADKLFEEYDLTAPSLRGRYYADSGIKACIDSLDDDAPQELRDALDEWLEETEKKWQELKDNEEERQTNEQRKAIESDYDDDESKSEYLSEFYDQNIDRYSATAPESMEPKTWYVDGDSDRLLKFETSDGEEYVVRAIYHKKTSLGMIPDLQFSDSKGRFSVTGGGHAFEVFSNVVPAMVGFLHHEKPVAATFSAAEKSRQKVYDRLVKTVAHMEPDYFAAYADKGGTRYYVAGRRDEREKVEQHLKALAPDHKMLVMSTFSVRFDSIWLTPQGWEPTGGADVVGDPFRVNLSTAGSSHPVDKLIRQVSTTFTKLSERARLDLRDALRMPGTREDQFRRVRLVVERYTPELGRVLTFSRLAAMLAGMRQIVAQLPAPMPVASPDGTVETVNIGTTQTAPTPAPAAPAVLSEGFDPPVPAEAASTPISDWLASLGEHPETPEVADEVKTWRLPMIDAAVQSLADKQVMTRKDFDLLTAEAKMHAFTVAGIESEAVIDRVRQELADSVARGTTRDEFADAVEQATGTGTFLSDNHMDTVYRTGAMLAYADGQDRIVANPIVAAGFPYVETVPIRDSRLTELCRIVSESGIQGTGIFYANDPVWRKFRNPRHWRCRCGTTYITVEQAARKGIREAQEWLATGIPPANPTWVPHPPVDLPAGWAHAGIPDLLSMIRLGAAHAPAGGVTIGGKPFTGGEFIPGNVMAKATAEEKAKVESGDTVSADDVHRAVAKLAKGGLVHLADVREHFSDVPRETLDNAVKDAIKARKVTGSKEEGREGSDIRKRAARIELPGDDHIGYLAERTEYTEESKPPQKIHERQQEIVDRTDAESRDILSRLKHGKIDHDEAWKEFETLAGRMEKNIKANFQNRYNAYKAKMVEKHGVGLLNKPEWKKARAFFRKHADKSLAMLDEHKDVMDELVRDYFRDDKLPDRTADDLFASRQDQTRLIDEFIEEQKTSLPM